MDESCSSAIELTDLTKTFTLRNGTRLRAVDAISLRIRRGEVVAFLGPNGAGKTTTLDIVLGLTRPDDGTVRVCEMSPIAAIRGGRVSALLQTGGLLADLTVRETVLMIASTFGARRNVDPLLERVGLGRLAGQKVRKLSGGQQQKLKFALALVPEPDVIVLDEPTAGMDVSARREFWDTMRADAARGRTIVFATHYLEEAEVFADRVVMISQGRVVADGPTAEIRALVPGRELTAIVPDISLDVLRGLPGVESAEMRGERVHFRTHDSDALARLLLTQTPACELEIAGHNLESAFVSLTHTQKEAAR